MTRDQGPQRAELTVMGQEHRLSAEELREAGFSAEEFKQVANFTATELKDEAKFTTRELKTVNFTAAESKEEKFTAKELKNHAKFTAMKLKLATSLPQS